MTKGLNTRRLILEAGATLWATGREPTASAVARRLGISQPAICYHFPTSAALKKAVASHAVETGNSRVVAQLIATNNPAVQSMTLTEISQTLDALKLRFQSRTAC